MVKEFGESFEFCTHLKVQKSWEQQTSMLIQLTFSFHSRLLQMGVYNAELFTNLGLCCFFAQQYDMTLNCFERALALASDENMADVWYNIGHVAVVKIRFLY